MEAQSLSISGSRDGVAGPLGDSVCDDYDELSNATVGTSNPLGRMEPQSPRSDAKSQYSNNLSPSPESGDARPAPAEPPMQLPLSSQNLHGFTVKVETGALPLRVDVIPDDKYVNYVTRTPETDVEKKEQEERADISVVTVTGRTQDAGDLGSDAVDSNTYESNVSLHGAEASVEGNAWNIERASVDAQMGSPTRRHADPLNAANLDRHLHDLTRGPAPLFVENVVTDIPAIAHERNPSTMAVAPEEATASNAVDPSEMDTQSYSEAISPLRNRSMKQSSVGDAMDDMWSTASTRGPDVNPFATADENPHALSTKNLRQLRHQLESGKTPLRPEVLVGLSSMVRVMTQTNSNKSTSTAVEAPVTEDRSKRLGGNGTNIRSPMQSLADTHSSAALASLGGRVKESDPGAVAGMSFHSTLVEVPATEPGDRRGGSAMGEFVSRQFTVSEPVDASSPDVDGENVGNVDEVDEEDAMRRKSSSDDSREGQNESVFNMTEDDGVDDISESNAMARHMRELFKLVQESQRDQTHLRQQVLEQRSVIERLQNTVQVLEAELSALKKK
jgi:hypothetical protein